MFLRELPKKLPVGSGLHKAGGVEELAHGALTGRQGAVANSVGPRRKTVRLRWAVVLRRKWRSAIHLPTAGHLPAFDDDVAVERKRIDEIAVEHHAPVIIGTSIFDLLIGRVLGALIATVASVVQGRIHIQVLGPCVVGAKEQSMLKPFSDGDGAGAVVRECIELKRV